LAAVKVILKNSDLLSDKEHKKQVMKKLAAPLVTLLGNEPEIQYISLRNISFILQKDTSIFEGN